jgi:hypothetical protein
MVERHRDGIPDQWLRGRQLDSVPGLELEARQRLIRTQGAAVARASALRNLRFGTADKETG